MRYSDLDSQKCLRPITFPDYLVGGAVPSPPSVDEVKKCSYVLLLLELMVFSCM